MQHRSRFARTLCVAVDAASYSRRDNVAQHDLQELLAEVLDEAAAGAGLDRSKWLRQAQGDGELALIPADQPEPRLVDDFIRELDAVLWHRNYGRVPDSRLRLRVAMEFGVAYEASFGFAGDAVVATARLLASRCLHAALAQSDDADLVVALSQTVFATVVNRHTSLSSGEFVRADVIEKEYRGVAWIRVLSRQPNAAPAKPAPTGNEPGSSSAGRATHGTGADGTSDADRPRGGGAASAPRTGDHNVTNSFYAPVQADVIGMQFVAAREQEP